MKLSIIIVSWNARQHLLKCLESINDTAAEDAVETIVVDNASTDGGPDAVALRFPQVGVIRNAQNLGFAKGNNIVLQSRRAFLVLESFVNVLNVFLKAPNPIRIQNLMSWEQIGERSAAEKIKKEEHTRKKIIESFYKKKWDSFKPWTLVLNTHKLGFELCEQFVIQANSRVATCDDVCGWQDGFPSIDTIEVDPILEKAVNKVLIDKQVLVAGKE